MKRFLIELVAGLVVLAVLFLVIFVGAGFFGSTMGATMTAVAPDFHLQMADRLGLVCHAGETVSIDHSQVVTGVDSRGHAYAGQSNDIYCISTAEKTSRKLTNEEYLNVRLATLGAAVTGYTLLCFVPLFLPLAIVALFVIHKIAGALLKPRPASQSVISNN
jgi:hypothetical protein